MTASLLQRCKASDLVVYRLHCGVGFMKMMSSCPFGFRSLGFYFNPLPILGCRKRVMMGYLFSIFSWALDFLFVLCLFFF